MHFLRHLSVALVVAAFPSGTLRSSPPTEPLPDLLIGYTEFRIDLPAGRGARRHVGALAAGGQQALSRGAGLDHDQAAGCWASSLSRSAGVVSSVRNVCTRVARE